MVKSVESVDGDERIRTVDTREKNGGDERIRTVDLLRAKQALSQLSYIPTFV